MKKILILTLASFSFSFFLPAQSVTEEWVQRYSNADSIANTSVAVDVHRHVFVAGTSFSSSTSNDFTILKYDTAGNLLWAQQYDGGFGSDVAAAMAADDNCNVYVTGTSANANSNNDFLTVKYDGAGNLLWAAVYDAGDELAVDIEVDAIGNVYVTGNSWNGVNQDYVTIKYDPLGNQLWAVPFDGSAGLDEAVSTVKADALGNVYITGCSMQSNGLFDYVTIKYDSTGLEVWNKQYNGPAGEGDMANDMVLDNAGNVYVTGWSAGIGTKLDYATIKYDSNGNELWVARHNDGLDSNDVAMAIDIDNNGNVYVTGRNFTPQPSPFLVNHDFATLKYDSGGNELWLRHYNGPSNAFDSPLDIAVDANKNVYVTGASFDNASRFDYATVKYSTNGDSLWAMRYNGPGNKDDIAASVALDASGNVYVTGRSSNGTNFDIATIKYSQPGISCANAIDLGQGDTCVNNITMSDTVMWLTFTADSDYIVFSAFSTIGDTINTITLYSGTCNGLVPLYSSRGGDNDTLYYSGFYILNGTYYLRITGDMNNNLNTCIFHSDVIFNAKFCPSNLPGPGAWANKTDSPQNQLESTGFAVGNYGYVGTGGSKPSIPGDGDDFHRWNPITNSWCSAFSLNPPISSNCNPPLGSFPGGPRAHDRTFTIQDKGYITTGVGSVNLPDDLYEYNTTTNTWTQRLSIPTPPANNGRGEAAVFSIGTNGYVGLGYDGATGLNKVADFWRWDGNPLSPTFNQWFPIAQFPGSNYFDQIALTICDKGYVGGGAGGGPPNEWWEYDPVNDTWTQMTSMPSPSAFAGLGGFSLCCKGYISMQGTLCEYDAVADNWTLLPGCPDPSGSKEFGFSLQGKGYIGGVGGNSGNFQDFWEWTPNPVISYASPSANFTANPNPICAGGCITYTPNTTGTCDVYNWTFQGGNPSSSMEPNPVVCYSVAGTYSVSLTVTNCGGWATSIQTITVNPPPPPPVISGNPNDCTNPATYFVTPVSGVTYSWTANGGTVSPSTGTNVSVNWNLTTPSVCTPTCNIGSISVTANYSPGCTSTASMMIFPCCSTQAGQTYIMTALNNTSVTAAAAANPSIFVGSPPNNTPPYTVTSGQFAINGTFTIDAIVTFVNSKLDMGPDAKILVQPGTSLSLNSNMSGQTILQNVHCCAIMWDGIYLADNTAQLITSSTGSPTQKTTIQDAKNAVVSNLGGVYSINNTILQRNNIDIVVNPYPLIHPGVLRGCTLTTGTTPLLPYIVNSNQCLSALPRTNIGMKINTVADIQIGSSATPVFRNLFNNMDYGIHSTTSKIVVYNNWFQNIHGFLSGYGIYATGTQISPPPMGLTVGGIGANQPNTFRNCGFGVYAISSLPSISIIKNTFINNVSTAWSDISVGLCPSANINISRNTLTNSGSTGMLFGIACVDVPLSNTTISTNTVICTNPLTSATAETGIYVANAATLNMTLSLVNNKVENKTTGIWLRMIRTASTTVNVSNNTVRFGQPNSKYASLMHFGIRAEGNCLNAYINANTITKTGANPASGMVNTLRGISVENSPQTTVIANTMTKTGSGIYCDGGDNNSKLACNNFNFTWNGIFFNSANVGNQLSTGPNGNAQRNQWIGTVSSPLSNMASNVAIAPPIYFWWQGGGTFDPNPLPGMAVGSFVVGQPAPTNNNTNVCLGQLAPPPPQQARVEMFSKIVQNQEVFTDKQNERSNWSKQYAHRYFRENPNMLNLGAPDDTLYQNFYSSQQAGCNGKFADVLDLISNQDVQNALSVNSSTNTTCTIEQNRKTVNEIYINSWMQGKLSFPSSDSSTLYNIAVQDPIDGGDAVYSARVMLGLDIDPSNSSNNRTEQINNRKITNHVSTSKIYPNPNDGTMQLDYSLDEGQKGVVVIYELTGRKIKSYQLTEGEINTLKISENALQNGIYFYEIVVDNKVIDKGKIIIIK